MLEVNKIVDFARAKAQREKDRLTDEHRRYLERKIYGRRLNPVEKEEFEKLSTEKQQDRLVYRYRILNETDFPPWASADELKAWYKKRFVEQEKKRAKKRMSREQGKVEET